MPFETPSRFVLGTAQLGLAYGVANRTGRPGEAAAAALVAEAVALGVSGFDTAAAYGDSEAVLGRAFAGLGLRGTARVVTKGSLASGPLAAGVHASLRSLGIPRLEAWLLHDEGELAAWDARAQAAIDALLAENQIEAAGASVYHPEAACRALDAHGFGALQFPASPFDRRFLRGAEAGRILGSGARLFVRSVYLQGLGLMDPAQVPAGIHRGREAAQALADFCGRRGLDRDHFCVGYVLQRTARSGARLVLGMETRGQLARNAGLFTAPDLPAALLDEWDELWPDDIEDLVLPYRWAAPASP
jgi:aryl-alcohol dehydrogenase-like predicted oxidoreductase